MRAVVFPAARQSPDGENGRRFSRKHCAGTAGRLPPSFLCLRAWPRRSLAAQQHERAFFFPLPSPLSAVPLNGALPFRPLPSPPQRPSPPDSQPGRKLAVRGKGVLLYAQFLAARYFFPLCPLTKSGNFLPQMHLHPLVALIYSANQKRAFPHGTVPARPAPSIDVRCRASRFHDSRAAKRTCRVLSCG